MKTTDYIAEFLHAQGVTHVFELVGGMTTHLIDSLHQMGRIHIVSVHHEQAAAFAVDAMGRVKGRPAVAMATSGPGATNLLTGIGSCYFDSSPGVFITGQVNRNELKGDRAIRQLGFQETDIVSMAAPITKGAWLVEDPHKVPQVLEEAFQLAISGRPGPVLVDIPMDVQRADIHPRPPVLTEPTLCGSSGRDRIEAMFDDLNRAERPLILVGGGLRASRATPDFRKFADLLRVPVVNSLLAVDALPYSNPLRVGMIGSYGNRWANKAIGESDFLLVLGSRLDIRQTGADTESFGAGRVIYHVDCEPGEMNNRIVDCREIHADLREFLIYAQQVGADRHFPERAGWIERIETLRADWPDTAELRDIKGINPNAFMHHLSGASRAAASWVVDVGQHQMWAAQSVEVSASQSFMTSAGMGAMGFGLPAAVGAAFSYPGQPVVMIAGDGSFQVNIQELQTVTRNHLPIKIVVINNRCHGMVRQFQESYFDERYQSTYWGYSTPDFARVAEAYGIPSMTVADPSNVAGALEWMWRDPSSPCLLEVMVDTFANAYPKLAFGRPITEMEPHATPLGMEST